MRFTSYLIPGLVILAISSLSPRTPAGGNVAASQDAGTGRIAVLRGSAPASPTDKTPSGRAPRGSSGASTPSSAAVGRATDPETGADPCENYSVDGVRLGMTRTEVGQVQTIRSVPRSQSQILGFEDSTFAFRARRWGRVDDVQVGFDADEKDPRVRYVSARILVARSDPWPKSLVAALGSPKRAKGGEWVFWDLDCGATLRLMKMPALGPGEGEPYLLEVQRTRAPKSPADSEAPASSETPGTQTPATTEAEP